MTRCAIFLIALPLTLIGGCQRPTQKLPPAPLFTAEQLSPPKERRPVLAAPVPPPFGKTATLLFERGSAELPPQARAMLDREAAWLRDYPLTTIVVTGHGDPESTREVAFALGERRASAVRFYLSVRGVAFARSLVTSHGKQQPAGLGLEAAEIARNRRVEISIIGAPPAPPTY